MKHAKGYTLMEVAIVLLIISLLIPVFMGGFSLYRERAEYIGEKRSSELDDLIAMGKAPPEPEAPVVDPVVVPDPEPEVEPEPDEVADAEPFWKRWLDWWRDRKSKRRGRRS